MPEERSVEGKEKHREVVRIRKYLHLEEMINRWWLH